MCACQGSCSWICACAAVAEGTRGGRRRRGRPIPHLVQNRFLRHVPPRKVRALQTIPTTSGSSHRLHLLGALTSPSFLHPDLLRALPPPSSGPSRRRPLLGVPTPPSSPPRSPRALPLLSRPTSQPTDLSQVWTIPSPFFQICAQIILLAEHQVRRRRTPVSGFSYLPRSVAYY